MLHHHMSSKRRAHIARYGEPLLQIRSEMKEPLTSDVSRTPKRSQQLDNKITDMGRKKDVRLDPGENVFFKNGRRRCSDFVQGIKCVQIG